MFEKEAEEYATRECCGTCNKINHFCKEKCECWTFARKGAEFGYNKANEWHYPSKDEFPTENTMLLLARKTVNGNQALIGYYRKEQFEVFNEKSCKMNSIDNIYAWKEIVLPELPKESE